MGCNNWHLFLLHLAHLIFLVLCTINIYAMFIFYIYLLRISFLFSILYIDCMGVNPMDEKMCLVDSGTTNSILKEIKYFQTLIKNKGNILTIVWRDAVIVGSGWATIMLPMGTLITIEDALLYPDSTRTLLSYRDIWKNVFHIETHNENNEESLLITKDNRYGKDTLERVPSLPSGLYYIYITRTTCCV
jgi:hypothetical protein